MVVSCSNNKNSNAKIKYSLAIDMGNIYTDSAKGNIIVYNMGEAPLRISKVQPSCHCTVAQFDSSYKKQNDSSVISYTISLTDTGFFEKNIVFEANTDSFYHSVIISGIRKK